MDRKMAGWLVLDLLGSLLFVVGAIGQFSGDGSLLPQAWQFPGHNLVLIVLGIAMILPYTSYVIRKGNTKRRG